jgi:hypothetical protein
MRRLSVHRCLALRDRPAVAIVAITRPGVATVRLVDALKPHLAAAGQLTPDVT